MVFKSKQIPESKQTADILIPIIRSVEEAAEQTDPEAFFSLVNSMDAYGCGKQLVCELEAKSNYAPLDKDEALMVWLFG